MLKSNKAKIKVELDCAEVFDRLSILEIKKMFCFNLDTKKYLAQSSLELMNLLNLELTYDFARMVYLSPEYVNLFNANRSLFKAIDDLKRGDIDAKSVDDLNYQRYKAKAALQEKYFGKLEEIKIGY